MSPRRSSRSISLEIVALLIGAMGCIASWLALPQIQREVDSIIGKESPTSTYVPTQFPSDTVTPFTPTSAATVQYLPTSTNDQVIRTQSNNQNNDSEPLPSINTPLPSISTPTPSTPSPSKTATTSSDTSQSVFRNGLYAFPPFEPITLLNHDRIGLLTTYETKYSDIRDVLISYDLKTLLLPHKGGILVYDAISLIQQRGISFENEASSIDEMIALVSPVKRVVAVANREKIFIYNIDTLSLVSTLEGHQGRIVEMIFSEDGSLLASRDSYKKVRVWNPATKELILEKQYDYDDFSTNLSSIALSSNNAFLAIASITGKMGFIETIDLSNKTNVFEYEGCKSTHFKTYTASIVFSIDSTQLLCAADQDHLYIWDIGNKLPSSTFNTNTEHTLIGVGIGNDLIFTTSINYGGLKVWQKKEGSLIRNIETKAQLSSSRRIWIAGHGGLIVVMGYQSLEIYGVKK